MNSHALWISRMYSCWMKWSCICNSSETVANACSGVPDRNVDESKFKNRLGYTYKAGRNKIGLSQLVYHASYSTYNAAAANKNTIQHLLHWLDPRLKIASSRSQSFFLRQPCLLLQLVFSFHPSLNSPTCLMRWRHILVNQLKDVVVKRMIICVCVSERMSEEKKKQVCCSHSQIC